MLPRSRQIRSTKAYRVRLQGGDIGLKNLRIGRVGVELRIMSVEAAGLNWFGLELQEPEMED